MTEQEQVQEPTQEQVEQSEKELQETMYDHPDSRAKAEDQSNDNQETKTEQVAKDSDEQVEAKEESQEKENQDESDAELDYALELKEESLLDNSMLQEVEALAKENNLSKDQANKLLELQEKALSKLVDEQNSQWEKEREEWRETVMNHKELGGDNLPVVAETSRRLIEKYASEDFINILRETGYGDHPEFVSFVYKVGKAMSNDSLIMPKTQQPRKSTEELFYGQEN